MSTDERFKIFIAAYLVLIDNERVLLLRRANTGYQDGNYSLVAGHLDGGETARQCIIREAAEEAGIDLKHEDLEIAHIQHRYNPNREYIDIYIKTDKWQGEIKNLEPEKCEELKWFAFDNLPENIIPEVKLSLENIKNKVFYGETGW